MIFKENVFLTLVVPASPAGRIRWESPLTNQARAALKTIGVCYNRFPFLWRRKNKVCWEKLKFLVRIIYSTNYA